MPTPQQIIIGGALVIANEAKSLAEDSDINYTFQSAEKKASGDDDPPEACENCPVRIKHVRLPKISYKNLLTIGLSKLAFWRKKPLRWDVARVRLTGRWEYNGCDIAGATFYFGNSTANTGWSINVEAEVLSSMRTGTPGCKECCERCCAIAWRVDVKIIPPIQSNRIFTAFPYMYGDGNYSGFHYT